MLIHPFDNLHADGVLGFVQFPPSMFPENFTFIHLAVAVMAVKAVVVGVLVVLVVGLVVLLTSIALALVAAVGLKCCLLLS